MRIAHGAPATLALGVLDVHAGGERPGPVQRIQRHQVLEAIGLELADQRAHPSALQLEHADGVALLEHLVRRRVVQREVVHVERRAAVAQEPDGVLDHRQVPQPQEVHLQQAELLDAVHVELRHDAPRVVPRVLGELERQVVHERRVADHDAGGVHRVLPTQTLQRLGRVDDLARLGFVPVGLSQLGRQLQRVLDRVLATQDRLRVHLAEPVAHRRREPQHAGGVADALLPLDRLERDDLRDVVGPVPAGHVLDDLVAAADVEVHVDVGHLLALGVQEPLEDQPVPQGVEVGDAQAVRHDGPGGRPTPGADPRAALAGEADEVPDDQEVPGEAHAADDGQLLVDPRAHLLGDVPVALLRALVHQRPQVVVQRHPVRRIEARQVEGAELHRQVAGLGDGERRVAGLGPLGEHRAHLLGGLQVELVGIELEARRVALDLLLLDAQQHVVGPRMVPLGVVDVVGGRQGHAGLGRQLGEHRVQALLLGDAVVLELEVEVARPEQVAVVADHLPGTVAVPRQEQARGLGGEAAGERGEPLGVLGQELLVGAGPVVEPLDAGVGDDLQEVPVAGLVPRDEREVPVRLVVVPALAVEPRGRRDVGLDPDDRLDPRVPGGLVEVQGAEHDAVVRDGDGGHAELGRLADHVTDA